MAFNVIDATVCGIRNYSFTGDKGDSVAMCSVPFLFNDARYEGQNCGMVNISEKKAITDGIRVGSRIRVVFYDKKYHYFEAV